MHAKQINIYMSTFCITLFVLYAQFINVAALVGHVEEDRVFFFFFLSSETKSTVFRNSTYP